MRSTSFFLNEARNGMQPNVQWRARRTEGRDGSHAFTTTTFLGWVVTEDVAPGSELLVEYDGAMLDTLKSKDKEIARLRRELEAKESELKAAKAECAALRACINTSTGVCL